MASATTVAPATRTLVLPTRDASATSIGLTAPAAKVRADDSGLHGTGADRLGDAEFVAGVRPQRMSLRQFGCDTLGQLLPEYMSATTAAASVSPKRSAADIESAATMSNPISPRHRLRRISRGGGGEHGEHSHKPDRRGPAARRSRGQAHPGACPRQPATARSTRSAFECSMHSTLCVSGRRFFVTEYPPDAAGAGAISFASKQE